MKLYRVLFKISFLNIFRNWRHSSATTASITFGFLAISLFDGFLKEVEFRQVDGYTRRGMLGDIVIQQEGAEKNIDLDVWKYSMSKQTQDGIRDFVKSEPRIVNAVRFLTVSGTVSAGTHQTIFMGYGYDVIPASKVRGPDWIWNTIAGTPLHLNPDNSILIGSGLASQISCALDPTIKFLTIMGTYTPINRPFECKSGTRIILTTTTESAQVNTIDLNVVGIIDGGFREINKRMVHMPIQSAQKLLDTDKITMMSLQLDDSRNTSDVIENLKSFAASKNISLEIRHWRTHKIAAFVNQTTNLLNIFRNLFMSVVILISLMSIANTMIKAVTERTREIGTLRSIGYNPNHVTFMFGAEGFLLSMIACLFGLVLAVIISAVVNRLGLTYRAGLLSMPVPLRIDTAAKTWLISLLLLSTLSLVTAVLTSYRSAKRKVAENLSHI